MYKNSPIAKAFPEMPGVSSTALAIPEIPQAFPEMRDFRKSNILPI